MTERKRALGSNLSKVDAHVIQPEEYDDIPELTDEWFAKAELHEGGKPVRRGRPPANKRKQLVTLRIDPDVIEAFKADGPGWQTRMTDVLKAASLTLREGKSIVLHEHRLTVASDVSIPGHVVAMSSQDFNHEIRFH